MREYPAGAQPEQCHRNREKSEVIEEYDGKQPGQRKLKQQAGAADDGNDHRQSQRRRRRYSRLGVQHQGRIGHLVNVAEKSMRDGGYDLARAMAATKAGCNPFRESEDMRAPLPRARFAFCSGNQSGKLSVTIMWEAHDVQSARVHLRGRDVLFAGDHRPSATARKFGSDLAGESVSWLVDYRMDRLFRLGLQRTHATGGRDPAPGISPLSI